jgi:ribonucleotide reductase beta subunit family protein with ferritin-like domain
MKILMTLHECTTWIQIHWMEFQFHSNSYELDLDSIEEQCEANRCIRYWKFVHDYGVEK